MRSLLMLGCACIWMFTCALSTVAQGGTPGADPDTLFLTWFGDPTTSIVAQWLVEGERLPLAEGSTDALPGFDVPKVEEIKIDGDISDWAGRGFEVGYLAGLNGKVYKEADLGASAKIGWDPRGLLVLVQVRDDVGDESADVESLWAADSIEFFVSTGVGSDQRYQVLIAPGADVDQTQTRKWSYDYRRDRASGDLVTQHACTLVQGGYVVELLLPWSNLGIKPEQGDKVAFQFYVNDRDGGADEKTTGIWWHPSRDAHERPESMYALRLTDHAGLSSRARANVRREGKQAQMIVWADASLAGQVVTAKSGGATIGHAKLYENLGGATAVITLDDAPDGKRWGIITAHLDEEMIAFAKPMLWMSVTWLTPVAVQCKAFAEDESETELPVILTATTTIIPFGSSGLYVQRAAFDGLEPGGEYVLRIGDANETGHRFRTAPAELKEPIVFAEGGDVGVWKHVAPLHKIAASWEPRFGLIGGDCAYANGRTPKNWIKFLKLWRANMVDPNGRLIPMLCAIGNHEVDGGWGQTLNEAPFFMALFGERFDGKSYAAVDFGDYLSILLLDSGHVTPHDGEQLSWLNEALASRSDRPHLFTAYHVPAYPSHRSVAGKYSVAARKYWVPLFDKYGVDVSFEHHDHAYKRTHVMTAGRPDPQGVLYLGDGAWGMKPRKVATPAERTYLVKVISSLHVIKVTLDPNGRSFEAINEKGGVIDRYPESD